MIKTIVKSFTGGMAVCMGYMAGADLYGTLRNPVKRKEIKKKITSVVKREKN